MDRLRLAVDRLADLLFSISLLAGALMMVHVTIDVIARTVLNSPLAGANEITAHYYMVAAAFLPLAYVTRQNQHISVELFTQHLSAAGQHWVGLVSDVLMMLYVALFSWQTWVGAVSATEEGEAIEIPGGFLEVWPMRWSVAIAGGVVALYLLLRIVRTLTQPASPAPAASETV